MNVTVQILIIIWFHFVNKLISPVRPSATYAYLIQKISLIAFFAIVINGSLWLLAWLTILVYVQFAQKDTQLQFRNSYKYFKGDIVHGYTVATFDFSTSLFDNLKYMQIL